MRYVILRDDDTNALTPVECLERLYRPFLDHGLPVNLATIPDVSTNAKMSDGRPEGFLVFQNDGKRQPLLEPAFAPAHGAFPPFPFRRGEGRGEGSVAFCSSSSSSSRSASIPLATNPPLVRYLLDNPGFHIVQHGCHHDYFEFDLPSRADVAALLNAGTQRLLEAGFQRPQTFVAPYDRLSRAALLEVSDRFRVLSSGWYELGRLPAAWWPQYLLKKLFDAPHWQVGRTVLLSHPGCLLSYMRSYSGMLEAIISNIQSRRLTVLVTHWWEYFRHGQPDEPFIGFLHETADYLTNNPEIKVVAFSDLANGKVPLN